MITFVAVLVLICVIGGPMVYIGRALWGRPEEGDSEWSAALAPALPPHVRQLAPAPVEVIRIPPALQAAVEYVHVGASEAAPETGAIGTLAARPSDDLLTFEQQVAGEPDEWAWFQDAMVAYEDALLTLRKWPRGVIGVDIESTQQRIDRWLSEGGVSVRHHRADARMAASDTWDAPSGSLPVLDSYVADRMAEALLAS